MNPSSPLAAGVRLRFVVIGGSIASDCNNPVATSARAVLAAIAEMGHDVTFLEQRGNPFLTELFAARGSRPFRAFTDRYPGIQFRTYDLPRGWERTVWFGREIATADAVMALPGTPDTLLPEIAALNSRHVVRLVDESLQIGGAEFRLTRGGVGDATDSLTFGPAVTAGNLSEIPRAERLLLVAYDDGNEAESLRTLLRPHEPVFIQTGSAVLEEWRYVPEVELPEMYAKHRAAVVTGAGNTLWAEARRLQPIASGCASIDPELAQLTAIFEGQRAAELPAEYKARTQAESIVSAVGRLLGR